MRAAAALGAVWLLCGLVGVGTYISRYYDYRGFPPPKDPVGIAPGRLQTMHFYSTALHQRRAYLAYLPPGYDAAAATGRRFPVIYLLHAPPGRPDGYVTAGAMAVRADELIDSGRTGPFIVVLPYGKSRIWHNDTEWANAGAGRYEDFVIDTVRDVDARLATRRSRGARAIGGLSEGGYGAVNIALHHLRTFSVIESWSGYFRQTPTASFTGASPAQLYANSPTEYVGTLRRELRRFPVHAFLYQGSQDDLFGAASMRRFATRLRAAGGHVQTAVYPGRHSWKLWRSQMGHMLSFADGWFRQAGSI